MPKGRVFVIGSAITDLTFYCNSFPSPGQTVKGNFDSGLGGKGFNQAVAAKLAGAEEVHFIGAVGSDNYGRKFLDKLEELDINAHLAYYPEPTGAASIVVNKKSENQIVVALGANACLQADLVEERLNILDVGKQENDIILLQLETNYEVVDTVLRKFSGTKILNPAPYTLGYFNTEWLNLATILTPNETESKDLIIETGIDLTKPVDLKSNLPTPHYIETWGEKGVIWTNHPYSTIHDFQAIKVEALDSSGAGDAFNGALAAGILKYGNLKKAIPFAIIAAGLSVTKRGTSKSFASEKEILERLENEKAIFKIN